MEKEDAGAAEKTPVESQQSIDSQASQAVVGSADSLQDPVRQSDLDAASQDPFALTAGDLYKQQEDRERKRLLEMVDGASTSVFGARGLDSIPTLGAATTAGFTAVQEYEEQLKRSAGLTTGLGNDGLSVMFPGATDNLSALEDKVINAALDPAGRGAAFAQFSGVQSPLSAINAATTAGLTTLQAHEEQLKHFAGLAAGLDSNAFPGSTPATHENLSERAAEAMKAALDPVGSATALHHFADRQSAMDAINAATAVGLMTPANNFAELSKQYDEVLGKLPKTLSDVLGDETQAQLEADKYLNEHPSRKKKRPRVALPDLEPFNVPNFEPRPLPTDPKILEIHSKQLVLLNRLVESAAHAEASSRAAAAVAHASSRVTSRFAVWGLWIGALTLLATLVGIAATLGWLSSKP